MKGDILRKTLLILVYLEAVYFLSPADYPHNAPTITLDIVNKKDVS